MWEWSQLLFNQCFLSFWSQYVQRHNSGMHPPRYMENTVMVLVNWKLTLCLSHFNFLLPIGRKRAHSTSWNDWLWLPESNGLLLNLGVFLIRRCWLMNLGSRRMKFWITIPSTGAHSTKIAAEVKGNIKRMVEEGSYDEQFGPEDKT